ALTAVQLALPSTHCGAPKTTPIGTEAGNCDVTANGQNGLPSASGKVLPRAPDYTATLTADYKHVFNPGTFDINANLYLSGKLYFDSIQRVSQGAYTTLAAQASWQPAGSNFKFEVWA